MKQILFPLILAIVGILFILGSVRFPQVPLMSGNKIDHDPTVQNMTDTQGSKGDLYNGLITCGSDLLYYTISAQDENSHVVSWGTIGKGKSFNFKLLGSVIQAKARHACVGNSLLSVLSSKVDDESIAYSVSRYSLDSEFTMQNALIKGNLGFVRFENSFYNDVLYTRRNDQYVFRINSESNNSIKGPLSEGFSGRIMALKGIYSKKNGSRAIFAFRYKSYNESPVFKVYITLFYQEDKDEEWTWKNLYQATLTGIEDEYISLHDTYRLFFLSSPVIGASNDGKTLCFVFLKQFFTVEYDQTESADTFYGYRMIQQRINGPKVQPTDILIDDDGSMTILSEENEIFLFKRTKVHVKHNMAFDISQVLVLKAIKALTFPLFSLLFEEGFFGGEVQPQKDWSLEMMRNPAIDRIRYNKIAISMAKMDSKIFVLFDDMSLLTLGLDVNNYKISFLSVLLSRWDLVLAISLITLIFVLNEIRIQSASAARIIPNMTPPPSLLLILIFFGLSYFSILFL